MEEILVLAEHRGGELRPVTLELIARARELGDHVTVLLVGAHALAEALRPVADTLLLAEPPEQAFEAELWHRVDLGRAPDPRLCRTCSRPLTHGRDGYGQCPEGCERRKVYAWKRTYWRDKLPADTSANTRLVWKVKRYWKLLLCYLPEAEQNDHYLAGIIAHTTDTTSRRDELLEGDSIAWPRVTPEEARRTIEALKDRLTHAVNKHAEATS